MKKIATTIILSLSFLSGANASFAATKTATFAGGCFWCMEKPYDETKGVLKTRAGYAGGSKTNATYKKVSSGATKHIESIQVTYDSELVSYEKLLDIYWVNIDPFDARGQFCDKGHQYTSAIFPKTAAERKAAKISKAKYEKKLGKKFATKITNFKSFYEAEAYHQDYYQRNPIRYTYYRGSCGRDNRLKAVWGNLAKH